MKNEFDPINNSPVTFKVFNSKGELTLSTHSLNNASDEAVTVNAKEILATDCEGNEKVIPTKQSKEPTRRELVILQMKLMDDIRDKANINIVTCGNCGTVLLHEMNQEEDIHCFGCKREMDKSDCPDFWYEGCQNNMEFDED